MTSTENVTRATERNFLASNVFILKVSEEELGVVFLQDSKYTEIYGEKY